MRRFAIFVVDVIQSYHRTYPENQGGPFQVVAKRYQEYKEGGMEEEQAVIQVSSRSGRCLRLADRKTSVAGLQRHGRGDQKLARPTADV